MDAIFVPTYRRDLRLTRICVASVRYFYPDLPLRLLVDENGGPCDVAEICDAWGATVHPGPVQRYGADFSKCEPLVAPTKERILIIDSDIVFAGPLLELFEGTREDFIVPEEDYSPEQRQILFMDDERLQSVLPQHTPVSVLFNAGQFVGRSGILRRDDFAPWIEFSSPRRHRHPDALKFGYQGILNLVINHAVKAGRITLKRMQFMRSARYDLSDIDLNLIKLGHASPYRCLIHWAGAPRRHLRDMARPDILEFFESHYYSRVPRRRLYFRLGAAFGARVFRRLRNPFGRRHRPRRI